MNIMEIIYSILSIATTKPVYAGTAAGSTQVRTGLVTFFQLPGSGIDFQTGVGVSLFQIDMWHADIYEVESIKEDVLKSLLGYAEIVDGRGLIINIDGDNGMLFEDSDQIYHASITIAIKHARRF